MQFPPLHKACDRWKHVKIVVTSVEKFEGDGYPLKEIQREETK